MKALLKLLFICLTLLSLACNTQEMLTSSYPKAPRKIITYYGGGYRYHSYSRYNYGGFRYGPSYRIYHGYGGGYHRHR